MNRPYELLARFAADGSVAGVSVRTIATIDGRDFEGDPRPLSGTTDPAFTAFADQFAAAIVAERDSLKSELAQLQTTLDAANARIAELEASLPWNHRIIDASAFIARISPIEIVELFGSSDPTTQQIAGMLKAYRENDWPVVFESPEMQQAIGYLQQTGLLTTERAAELTKDSTREEAYKAGE